MNLFDADGNPQALPYPESISFATLPILAAGRSVGAGHTSRRIDIRRLRFPITSNDEFRWC